MKRVLPIVSVSEIRSYRRCPREHHYAYQLGIRPRREANALRFGTLLHAGLEAWWQTKGDLDAALAAVQGEADQYDLARAVAMLCGYHARWAGEPFEVIAVEQKFRAQLMNPETRWPSRTRDLGGRIDALVRRTTDDTVWVMEHKTTSEDIGAASDYWRRLRMDAQISTYFVGARSLGFEPHGCLFDVCAKPGIRPLKATPFESRKWTKDGNLYANQREVDETPDQFLERLAADIGAKPDGYYQRGEVFRFGSDEADAALDTWLTVRAMNESARLGHSARNPDACVRYGRTCDYWDVCTGVARADDVTRFVNIKEERREVQP